MVEYKTFFISIKAFLNLITPLLFLVKEWKILSSYAASVLLPFSVLLYIWWKKKLYFNKYLYRQYTPSYTLFLTMHIIDLIILSILYICIYSCLNNQNRIIFFSALFFHFTVTVLMYILVFLKNNRTRAVISYTRHKYKLGIVSRDIGGENGLKKGQPVEIVQELSGGYIVKDNSKNDYELKADDIEMILDIVK
ncbi:hypothetical protein GINT2_001195 [Glugoides intestinalis]